MRILVTGTAGFIGSHVVEALARAGHSVHGLDSLAPTYDSTIVHANHRQVAELLDGFHRCDIAHDPLDELIQPVDAVVHLAGRPGVRESWGHAFGGYVAANVIGTQRLLDAAVHVGIGRFVLASSSSVYGDTGSTVVDENAPPRPISPYGVTKAAAENLCRAYAAAFELPTLALRFFSVYGPRQRPDMATSRAIEATLSEASFPLYGDGTQRRDFTYVGDVARSVVAACEADLGRSFSPLNIAGGVTRTVNEMIAEVESATGRTVRLERSPARAGDPGAIRGSIAAARSVLGWSPQTDLAKGIEQQVGWYASARG
jgi:UDP-glucuronate 4-epimerase